MGTLFRGTADCVIATSRLPVVKESKQDAYNISAVINDYFLKKLTRLRQLNCKILEVMRKCCGKIIDISTWSIIATYSLKRAPLGDGFG